VKQNAHRRPAIWYWGIAILVVGVASAVLIALTATDDDAAAEREIASGRMYQHNLELMGGKFAVLTAEFNDWFASLWHGRTLAATVAVLSVATAAACFLLARLTAPPPGAEGDPKRDP
jgi:hypothetical protein